MYFILNVRLTPFGFFCCFFWLVGRAPFLLTFVTVQNTHFFFVEKSPYTMMTWNVKMYTSYNENKCDNQRLHRILNRWHCYPSQFFDIDILFEKKNNIFSLKRIIWMNNWSETVEEFKLFCRDLNDEGFQSIYFYWLFFYF